MNKDIKREKFRKYPMNLIETNQLITIISDRFVSNIMPFKSHLNAKSFNLILSIMLPSKHA